MASLKNEFTLQTGARVPLIGGAMYPCSNAELVAAVSAAGGIGIIQPVTMRFVFGQPLREGIRFIRSITSRPIGFNALVEQTSRAYEDRMRRWVDIALEEGVRFFITALGNPRWVVERVHASGGIVYHDVTERKWAEKALEHQVDGLICVNNRAGGHAGTRSAEQLYEDLGDFGLPLVCAGGISSPAEFVRALGLGYAAVQMGTRFIATTECRAHPDYKRAILDAREEDVVLTERISGIPVSVINTSYVKKLGTRAGPLAKRLLRHPRGKRYMRAFYTLRSLWQLRAATLRGSGYEKYWQAGKSVDGIDTIESAQQIVQRFARAARSSDS